MDIFAYTSYRQLIRDFYEAQKQSGKPFSYQIFGQLAGFTTKTFLLEVISGRKKLSKNGIFGVAKAMKLKKKETDYFEALVNFNHADKLGEREFYFERMNSLAGKSTARMIGSDQYALFSKWYNLAVRELVCMESFRGSFEQLAKKVKPRITTKQAKEAVSLLLELKLIEKKASVTYQQSDPDLSTGDELKSLAVLKHQDKVIDLGREALDRFPPIQRDISTLTFGISEEGFATIKKEMQLFRKKLRTIIGEHKQPDRVYQLNFQLFPLSELPKKE